MVSLQDSHSTLAFDRFSYSKTRSFYYYTPPPLSSAKASRSMGRSMRTVRSNIFGDGHDSGTLAENTVDVSENITDSVIDIRLGELANESSCNSKGKSSSDVEKLLYISKDFSHYSACSSDISEELQRLARIPDLSSIQEAKSGTGHVPEPVSGCLPRESFSTEIIETESISPGNLHSTVKFCVDGLQSPSIAIQRSAAAKLRLLAKHNSDNRVLIGESGAVPALIPLLRCPDPATQEQAVTALLNLSLHDCNKTPITNAGAVRPLIHVLKTGTEVSKQNAACGLLSLASADENKLSIGDCGAVSPLVALLLNGSSRGKKDALTALYKLCSVKVNKERAVAAGAVSPLVGLVREQDNGLAEKAAVVLSVLAGIETGSAAIVEEGGIPALVEAVEDGSCKVKEFAVLTLLRLSVGNRGLLVREGCVPALVGLARTGTLKAKQKAETLLGYLRESTQEASPSSSPPTQGIVDGQLPN